MNGPALVQAYGTLCKVGHYPRPSYLPEVPDLSERGSAGLGTFSLGKGDFIGPHSIDTRINPKPPEFIGRNNLFQAR